MSEPILRLEARDAVRVNGAWRIRWRVTNVGSDHVRLVFLVLHFEFLSQQCEWKMLRWEMPWLEST